MMIGMIGSIMSCKEKINATKAPPVSMVIEKNQKTEIGRVRIGLEKLQFFRCFSWLGISL